MSSLKMEYDEYGVLFQICRFDMSLSIWLKDHSILVWGIDREGEKGQNASWNDEATWNYLLENSELKVG